MMKCGLVLIPLAAVVGMVVGSWGPRAELRAREKQIAEERSKPRTATDGFASFARMVNIPDAAKRPRRGRDLKRGKSSASSSPVTNKVAKATPPSESAPTTNVTSVAQEPQVEPAAPLRPEDLRARIEEAQELWRTRVELARSQWKERLKLDAAGGQKFDATLDDMNKQLYDTMQALADQISTKKTMTQELGLRLVGDATTIMAETYDKLGAVVPAESRDSVSEIQMTDFIDPGVAEPLIAVQGQLENIRMPHGFPGGRRRP